MRPRLTRIAFAFDDRILALRSHTSTVTSKAPRAESSGSVRYGSGAGSPDGRGAAATRKGSSASSVTIHGETLVAKFFARNGPSGWYSQLWMSRADQSFTRHSPQIADPASRSVSGDPSSV